MIVGSIKENLSLEKRVSITPETAKNIINLGLKVIIENNYASHIGIADKEYEAVGVVIKNSLKEVLNNIKICLVIIAKGPHPIPFRTRKLSPSAPMVLCLKIRESRTLPGF